MMLWRRRTADADLGMLDILGAVLHFASEPVGCRVGLKPSATPAHLKDLKVHIFIYHNGLHGIRV